MSKLIDQINAAAEAATRSQYYRQPCGCIACDGGVQQGHFACSQPSEQMIIMERMGYAVRAYDDGAWRWFVTDPHRS